MQELSRKSVLVPAALAALALAPAARAQSAQWLVDDDGGPGVHFTDLPPAIAAALPGDVIRVRRGEYSGFTLTEGLAIVGEFGAVVFDPSAVQGVPAGEHAMVAGVDFGAMAISSCPGTVTFDRTSFTGTVPLDGGLVSVDSCADVRFHRSLLAVELLTGSNRCRALTVDSSRVELASCTVVGGRGADWNGIWSARAGGIGIEGFDGARIHLALTGVAGGRGGKGIIEFNQPGGSGGHAVVLHGNSTAVVAGTPDQELVGGGMGHPYSIGNHVPGWGVVVEPMAELRHSGVSILRGAPFNSAGIQVLGSGVAAQAVPPDPTLEILGEPAPGNVIRLRLHAAQGTSGRLQQGNMAVVQADPFSVIEKLANRIRIHPLGPVPASGVLAYDVAVPSGSAAGRYRIFQGLEIDGASGLLLERTNSVPVIVR